MRVLMFADDPLMLAGLELVLTSNTDVTVSALTDRDLQAGLRDARRADVLLVASGRPELVKKDRWTIPIMWGFRTMESGAAVSVMRSLADGVTCLDCHLGVLTDGLRDLHRGGGYIAPCIAGRLVSFMRGESDAANISKYGMTARELQVLRLIAEGAANADIAAELKIEIRTVKHYASEIYRKLGAGGRAEAVALAFKNGLSL